MSRREQYREQTREEIKAIARRQMAEGGWPDISLNGIAKEMDVAVSGLYRYYENRDALLTALILDAYNAYGEAMETAEAAHRPRDDYKGRLLAAIREYRRWPLAHRAEFGLIYGTPVPGYHAPDNVTQPAANRAMVVVLSVLNDALANGATSRIDDPHQQPVREMGVPPDMAFWSVMGWTRLHGFVTLEVFGHLDNVIPDRDAFYDALCHELLGQSGIS